MPQTHHLPARLKFGKECWVYHSAEPADSALVFVHGFHGDATGTWVQFQSLLQEEANCKSRDLLFFGYHSWRRPTASSASSLMNLLVALVDKPESIDGWPARAKNTKYRRILVVAHSLGAIVCRLAFLMAWKMRCDWTDKLRLVLYAPAHLGGRPLKLIPKRMKVGMEFLFPTLEELLEGSKTIRRLQSDTKEALKERGSKFLRAVKVVHGRRDNIISQPGMSFCADPPCDWIEADHFQVCKPSGVFLDPLTKLREIL
jgi:pimeloyl-ACP methyl ester carboxylesterase